MAFISRRVRSPTGVLLAAVVGAANADGLGWIVRHSNEQGFTHCPFCIGWADQPNFSIGLTFDGWQRYEELQRTIPESHLAFMAMKYNDVVLDQVFRDCFKP